MDNPNLTPKDKCQSEIFYSNNTNQRSNSMLLNEKTHQTNTPLVNIIHPTVLISKPIYTSRQKKQTTQNPNE